MLARTVWLLSGLLLWCVAGCHRSPGPPPSQASQDWFRDITETAGVAFVHAAGTNYFMPDQMGSGIALLDADQDGRLDMYLVQNGTAGGSTGRNALYLQQSNGTFRAAGPDSGTDLIGRGMGAYAGDVNNDALPDLLVTEYGAIRLLLNLGGGRFGEVTSEAGLHNARWAGPASFIDYDRDGWLDIVVGNYVDYDPTQICHDVAGRQDFCAPYAFGQTATRLWRNITTQGGSPRFEDRTEPSGLSEAQGPALGICCADFTGDGWPDIFCADDGRPNRLFVNRTDGTFAEEAAQRGLAYNAMGATAANMGIAFADLNGDGLGDVFVTHLTEEFHSLWIQEPRGLFSDRIAAAGMQRQAWRGTGFGAVAGDFDSDGNPDLAFVNGLIRRAIPAQTPVLAGVNPWWARYAQRAQLFANTGQGTFQDISESNPAFCGHALVGRSLATGDLDGDGALDLVMAGVGGPVRVLRNVVPRRGHWVRLRLLTQHNREAIGAEVTVRAGGRSWWTVLQPATSYFASNEPVVHIGIGGAAAVEAIEVLWPDGRSETFPGGPAGKPITLRQGSGRHP